MTQEELNLLYQELDNYFSGFKGLETSNWNWRTDSLNVHGNGIVDFAKHFVEWQKEQILGDDNKQYHRLRHETLKRLYENEVKLELMLDKALEGYIEKYEQIGGHNYLSLKIPMLSKPNDCKVGDKVKVLIIKEE